MSSSIPKCSGWRFKGKTKYYLTLTCRKCYKPYASIVCRRDKLILERQVEPLRTDVSFEKTICWSLPRSDMRFYGIPQSFINAYYNQFHIERVLPWQIDLLSANDNAVLKGENLVYCAPTGVGKSLVYEILMLRRILFWKGQCLVILPYISLIEEKKRYFEELCEPNNIYVECFYASGSQRLDPHIDIAISTVEKANRILNRCLLEGHTPRISLVVIDEAQTLDSERGFLIELLLLKLRALQPSLQIVCLSATLPHAPALARWLHAQLFLFPHAPPSQAEQLVCDGRVTALDGALLATLPSPQPALAVPSLLRSVIPSQSTVLVFCPTKLRCEQLIAQLVKQTPLLPEPFLSEVLGAISSYRASHAAPLDPLLEKSLPHGLAVHHAGLTEGERQVGERLFRRHCITVVAATSTLSAGVNLNVDVVVVDGVRRCGQLYSGSEYRQMVGRTGRMGQAGKGMVFVVMEARDREAFVEGVMKGVMKGEMEGEREGGEEGKKRFVRRRVDWCQGLLEIAALGLGKEVGEMVGLVKRFAFFPSLVEAPPIKVNGFLVTRTEDGRVQGSLSPAVTRESDPFLYEVGSALCWLVNHHFLLVFEGEGGDALQCTPTELGEAAFRSSMNVEEVERLAKSLTALNDHLDISNHLQIIYHLTPLNVETHIKMSLAMEYMDRFLSDTEIQYVNREILPISSLNAIREGCGMDSFSQETQEKVKRFRLCLVVRDLLTYDNLDRTKNLFGLTKGVLQNIQMAYRVFYHMNLRILKCLHYDLLYEVFKSFEAIVVADLTPETMNLINQGIEMKHAVILAKNGYDTPESILNEEPVVLVSLLMDQMPWQDAYCEDDITIEKENEYEKYYRVIENIRRRCSKK